MSDYNPYEFVTVPSGWECKTLIDCTEDENISYGIVQPGQQVNDGISVIRVNNVNHGQLDLTNVLKVSPEVEIKYKRTRLKGGEVLLTLVGSTGQSFVAPKELEGWNVPRAIAVIRAKEEIGADWINLCLQSQETKHFLDVRANTTVQKTLNLKDVRDIPILIPPKYVKCSIENLALSLANKIELNRQTNQTLENIAQAMFKSWFVDFEPVKAKVVIREKGGNELAQSLAAQAIIAGTATLEQLESMESRPSGWEDVLHPLAVKNFEPMGLDYWTPEKLANLFPNSLVESELGETPEGWKEKKVGDIVERLKPNKRYTKKQVFPFGKVPVYEQGADILLGYHNDEPGCIATPESPLIIFGDHTCVMHLTCEPFDISQNVIHLAGRHYPTMWVYYALRRKQEFQEYRRHWSEFIIKEVIEPSYELAELYSTFVTTLYRLKEHLVRENNSLVQTRDALLPKLLSGELSVDNKQSAIEVEQ